MTNSTEQAIDELFGKYRIGFVAYSDDIDEHFKNFKTEFGELIEAETLKARIQELKKVDPIASHELAATVEERIATLQSQRKDKDE